MPIYELAAIGSAICWALTGVLTAPAAAYLGAFGFNLYRQAFVTLVLGLIVVAGALWQGASPEQTGPLILSGIIGIFMGDTLLYVALIRLGPRRTSSVFALNAPMAAVLGWAVLGEKLSMPGWAGVVLCACGVSIVVMGRPGRSGAHAFEAVKGSLWTGVGAGLLAALGQAVGSLIARPVMEQGFDPLFASLIRVATALICLSALLVSPLRRLIVLRKPTLPVFVMLAASGILAMVIGMSLTLFALQGGKVGIVSTLSALSPVFILPALWVVTGSAPSRTSWIGAIIAVAGMALIFAR